jgi:biopolymer transport protein ExbD
MNVKAVASTPDLSKKRIIAISVNETGLAFISKDTLTFDQLTTELQKRLWKSYMGTGKMYEVIRLQFTGTVPAVVQEGAINAIKKAQQNALIEICLEKHKKLYESLSRGQQRKIRKQFPALFQSDYM